MTTLRERMLGSAVGYRLFKVATRGDGVMGRMSALYVKAEPGDRLLDVGCGYGDLARHVPGVQYTGVDSNEKYIAFAQQEQAEYGEFVLGDVSDLLVEKLGMFDVAVAIGVLHHLSDDSATAMLRSVSKMLNSPGRFIAAEPVWEPSQRTTARVLAALDRGRYVREQSGYEALLSPWFPQVECEIRHDLFWFPYTHCMISATMGLLEP